MNFLVERKIEDGAFSVVITHESFGSEEMTAEEELHLYAGFGHPVVDLGGSFEGLFEFDEVGESVVENEAGAPISILLNSNKVSVSQEFKAEIRIGLKKIEESSSLSLPTKQSIAEAKCLLFEKRILSRIEEAVEIIKNKRSGFENGYPKEIII